MNENMIITFIVLICIVVFFMAVAGTHTERDLNNLVCKQLYSTVTNYDACTDRDIRVNIKLIKELK